MANSPVPSSAGDLPDDYLTPRTKVAKMLADIDNAPTPSPSNIPTSNKPRNNPPAATSPSNTGTHEKRSAEVSASLDSGNKLHGSRSAFLSDDSEDDVRRPQGRAAQRMHRFNSSPIQISSLAKATPPVRQSNSAMQDDEEDLYGVTPLSQRQQIRASSGSPLESAHGEGLFVSPARSLHDESDEDLPANPFGGKGKLAELVAQKRAERLEKEAEEKWRKDHNALAHASSDLPDEIVEDPQAPVDPNIERVMSDAAPPARKASKKALQEMERETQRMARQQALAHQMKVKKKFTANDLFAKFNFRRPGPATETADEQPVEGDVTSSSAPNSDGIEERPREPVSTPPSSPPTPLDRQKELVDQGALEKLVLAREDTITSLPNEDVLPDLSVILQESDTRKAAKGSKVNEAEDQKEGLKLAPLGKKAVGQKYDSSDDELEIISAMPAHLRVFDMAPGANRSGKEHDSKAIHNLKHLSHMHHNDNVPHKKGSRPSLNPKALESQLRRRAKEQARQQQLERIEELKAKGIEVQTSEEREKEAEEFENLLEKARQQAVELRKAEKAAMKEAGVDGAVTVSDDEDEDADYDDSGSEDDDIEGRLGEQAGDDLVDEAAEEGDDEDEFEGTEDEEELDDPADSLTGNDDEPEIDAKVVDMDTVDLAVPTGGVRWSRKSRILLDDDDEDDEIDDIPPTAIGADAEVDDPFAAFNFGAADTTALLSPTQAFNATMQTPTQLTQEDSFDILRRIAPSSMSSLRPPSPDFDTQAGDDSQLDFVAGSQVPESQRVSFDWDTQLPETPVPAGLNRAPSALSETPGWEPTQDPGLPSPWSVKLRRENTFESVEDHDTQSTVRMRISESPAQSEPALKRGRLVRRQIMAPDSDDEPNILTASIKPQKKDAFREMARRQREALTATEREAAEKEMRQMMDEAAEESDDEYAGLGGDDFVAPETEQDREMIDSSHVDVDERALAAHFAERQRQRDEAETSKLYKDLTTGVLRRKMGANAFDLDEDEDEVAVRRRQMRQMDEARKRKALLKDENIATLAEGRQSKGKDAFLKAIADDDGDEEVVNLSDGETETIPATQDDSQQSQSQHQAARPLQEISGNKRRRSDGDDDAEDKPPVKRRTEASAFRRPTSFLEVKESLSFLLEESNAVVPFGPTALELNSDSGGEEADIEPMDESDDDALAIEEARVNEGGFAPNPASMDARAMPPPRLPASQRRTAAKPAIVDRLTLKRGFSASESSLGRSAWAAGSANSAFKAPSLLRRATTNIASGANDRGVTTAPSLSRENSGVKMGGNKKSSLAYQARAEERKAIVEASARRREENTARIAQMRRNSSALGRGLTGRFE